MSRSGARVPLALVLLALVAWGQSARIVLRWKDVPGAVAYELQIGRDSSFVEVVLQTRTTTAGYRWEKLPSATHWWRVRSIDGEGRASEWSQPRSVGVDTVVPIPRAPPDNAVAACGSAATFTVEPSQMVRDFVLQLSSSKDFTGASELHSKVGSFTAPALEAGTWYWRVAAVDLRDKLSEKSPTRALVVRVAAPKPRPVADTIPGGSVTLSWAPSDCAKGYILEAWSEGGERVTLSAPAASFVFKTGGVGDYRWRVTGLDAAGKPGEWSAESRFRAKLAVPIARGEVVTRTAELSWGPVPGAASYRVEIASKPDFKAPEAAASVQGPFWVSPRLAPGKYSWRVQARDAVGKSSPPSEPRRFEVSPLVALASPALVQPAADAVVPAHQELLLVWQPVPEAARYVVEVDGRALAPVSTLSTRLAPLAEGEHRLRLRALGPKDRDSDWSEVCEVYVGVPPVTRASATLVGLEVRVTLFDGKGRAVTGAAPRFAVRQGSLGLQVARQGGWALAWGPPKTHQDVLLVDERDFHAELPLVEPPTASLELSLLAGGIFNGGAVASPMGVVGLLVALPVLDRQPFVEARAGLYGAGARLLLDGRPDVAGLTATPLSLLLGWRQDFGGFQARLAAGPMVQALSVRVGRDAETRLVPGFEVVAALGRRFGPGLVEMELGGLSSRLDSPLALLNAGGFCARIGYALPLPPGGL